VPLSAEHVTAINGFVISSTRHVAVLNGFVMLSIEFVMHFSLLQWLK
jgi:hypothetical protein